ncbi:hypothetical protein Btru_001872 [Bulinus truncatus]|nr:hypothetical protein Btru_001872 [Bulinus truncatus]
MAGFGLKLNSLQHFLLRYHLKTLQSVLLHLESTQGCVLAKKNQGHLFEVIWSGSRLANKVVKIINEACRSGKNADRGCHRMHIEDMLRKSPEYCSVPGSVLTHLLTVLETSSQVIMTEPQRYMGVAE